MATENENGSAVAHLNPHRLDMKSVGFFYLPAGSLGDEALYQKYRETIQKCQIFMIGLRPAVKLVDVTQSGSRMTTVYNVLGQDHAPEWPVPPGWSLKSDRNSWTLADSAGKKMFLDTEQTMLRLHEEFVKLDFNVLYIGQVFGGPGARNAIEQLRKGDLVKRINLAGVPDGYRLEVLLLETAGLPGNRALADDAEQITLCEAMLIKHFQPKFNRQPDGSFPSTKPRMLRGCANREISSIVVDLALEELPFRIFSELVEPQTAHRLELDMNDEAQKKAFFS